MTILHCPQVLNENGEHESVSNCINFVMSSHTLLCDLFVRFILAMVCERNIQMLHWLSHTINSICAIFILLLCALLIPLLGLVAVGKLIKV